MIAIMGFTLTQEISWGWSPTGGEEQRYFNQLVRESMIYKPPTPIRNRRGRITGYRGPTYAQQFQWEYNRQMNTARNAAGNRNSTINESAREMRRLEGSLASDKRVSNLRTKKANAQDRVDIAQNMLPDGPVQSQVRNRLGDTRTAGGRLDANRDGSISEAEMKTALSGRVSMQSTQYLNERKLDADGDNDIGGTETRQGLVNVTGNTALDHHGLLDERKAKPNYVETGIGKGTYVDASGNVRSQSQLNNPAALKSQLSYYNSKRDMAKNARDNDRMTPTKLRNGQLPSTTTRHASITTSGTWGTTRSWNGSWDAGGGINRSTAQLQAQMKSPQAAPKNNTFYNRIQNSTANLSDANSQAQSNLSSAQRAQNSTTGFKKAQAEVNEIYNNINR
jgi:hypothetical protein